MDPLDAPEPVALLESATRTLIPQTSQSGTDLSSGPTLSPAEGAEMFDDDAWEDEMEDAFFSTLDPAPERATREVHDDDGFMIRRRSRVPEILVGAFGVMMLAALGGFGVLLGTSAWVESGASERPAATRSSVEADVRGQARTPSMDAESVPASAYDIPIGELAGEGTVSKPRRRTRRARRGLPDRVVPPRRAAPTPAPRSGPVNVNALLPALSVEALPPAQ